MIHAIARMIFPAVVLLMTTSPAMLSAAEIYSNGMGGGPWSEPTTWRSSTVPGPEDTAVIAAGDAVVFDRVDDGSGGLACKDLYVDPKGLLTFKPGGQRLLAIAGPLESYGMIKLDGSGSADDRIEVRFTGSTLEQRNLKLGKEGALIAIGHDGLPDGKHNVVLRSAPPAPPAPAEGAPALPPAPPLQSVAYIDAVTGTSIDLRHVDLAGVSVRAAGIDNTGAKANERLNVTDCRFTGAASVAVSGCDTPSIVGNAFDHADAQSVPVPVPVPAIDVSASPLADIRDNAVSGPYAHGIYGHSQTDTVISGNTLSQCQMGIYWNGSNAMFKSNTVRGAAVGMYLASMSGAMEDMTFDNCAQGMALHTATIQATNLRFPNVPEKGVRIYFAIGALTLLNCDVTPDHVEMAPKVATTPRPRVEAMQFCVVQVKGKVPAGAAVDITTANPPKPLPEGAMDLNVRNAPAPIGSGGLTPLPRSLKPLIVKSWTIEGNGKLTAAPNYNLVVTAPTDKPDGPPTTLTSVVATPDASWYRADPDDATPTKEIVLP